MNCHEYSTAPSARRPRVSPRAITGHVYLASPLSTYGAPCYDDAVSRVRDHFPQATILPARDTFKSNADWRARWLGVLHTLDALVFFDDGRGCIGAGVFSEVIAATDKRRIPVWFLAHDGSLVSIDDVDIEPIFESVQRYARVRCRRPVDGATVPSPPTRTGARDG